MFGLFPLDIRKILLIVFVIALPLISINIQRNQGEAPWYLTPITWTTGHVQAGYTKLVYVVKDTSRQYLDLLNIKKENRQLKEKLALLESQMAVFKEVQIENERLTQLLEFQTREPMDLIPARVIGFDLFSQYATVKMNRGTEDGIQEGMAVITPKGVVGTVLKADPQSSSVLALTDRYSVIDAIVQRTRARGIVEGKTQTEAQLKYLQRTDDVQDGDLVVTSGLDPSLPEGFPIGNITKVEKKPFGITQYVELQPMVQTAGLEEVLVVKRVRKK